MMRTVQENGVASEDEHEDDLYPRDSSPDDASNEKIRGVIFGRSVRSSFCVLHVARFLGDDTSAANDRIGQDGNVEEEESNDDNWEPVMIRLQFQSSQVALRSYCRRFCKLGDLLVLGGEWKAVDQNIETEWQLPRLIVNLDSAETAVRTLKVSTMRYWKIQKCQSWQQEYLSMNPHQGRVHGVDCNDIYNDGEKPSSWIDRPTTTAAAAAATTTTAAAAAASKNASPGHGGGLGKRTQGEYVTHFVLHMIMRQLQLADSNTLSDTLVNATTWATANPQAQGASLYSRALERLNSGTGVVDAAGGSGHVSLGLGLAGVHSTVVDPRESVGKLPGRDRKIWNKALRRKQQRLPPPATAATTNSTSTGQREGELASMLYCQPVQYDIMRAWLGAPPTGVDSSFRHPDKTELPVCAGDHSLLATCSAIVALHPDEATDAIVDTAVEKRIPFVIVPCCVFFRLFPHRRKPGSKDPVSTHADLLEYLVAKDKSIQRTKLPFEGANVVLWSTF